MKLPLLGGANAEKHKIKGTGVGSYTGEKNLKIGK